jgi:hypothetical protein
MIPWLFGVTLLAALAIGIWQWMRVRRSQQRSGQEPGEVLATKHPVRNPGTPRGGERAAGDGPSPARPPAQP